LRLNNDCKFEVARFRLKKKEMGKITYLAVYYDQLDNLPVDVCYDTGHVIPFQRGDSQQDMIQHVERVTGARPGSAVYVSHDTDTITYRLLDYFEMYEKWFNDDSVDEVTFDPLRMVEEDRQRMEQYLTEELQAEILSTTRGDDVVRTVTLPFRRLRGVFIEQATSWVKVFTPTNEHNPQHVATAVDNTCTKYPDAEVKLVYPIYGHIEIHLRKGRPA